MKISIITATFNSSKTILRAISSIGEQSYTNIEWIIVDGASTDNTLEIIQQYSKLKPKIVSEPDLGIYNALNKGLKRVTGDIIGFLHSDDTLAHKNTLQDIHDIFARGDFDGLYGNLDFVLQKDPSTIKRKWISKSFEPNMLRYGWMPPHPTLFLKKTVYQRFGYFNESYKIAADYDFVLRIFKKARLKFHYHPQVITKMTVGGISNHSNNHLLKTKEDYKALVANGYSYPLIRIVFKVLSKVKQLLFKKNIKKNKKNPKFHISLKASYVNKQS
jgi:glycosyltransferase